MLFPTRLSLRLGVGKCGKIDAKDSAERDGISLRLGYGKCGKIDAKDSAEREV